ncbi:aminoglycoside 6-adenylyltransferase [Bordetella muralis]|uniref:aminoglycoside 6-adenylyltransferase n=1 Tax=Bordetella muralis TaxID=1649130 RepID=UPI0039EE8DA4
MDYEHVLQTISSWAKSNDNIRCVILTGSAAASGAHSLSDRDIELHVRDPKILETDDTWWETLGKVLAVERLENSSGQTTRLVYYAGGKLDFTLVSINDERGTYDRPFKVLLDKDGDASGFQFSSKVPEPPRQETFNECANWGYAAALMAAKAIVRNEPWSVKFRDNDLKAELLRMIEWDHIIRYNGKRDVRYLGTRMRQWMDADIQTMLEECWASFDLSDSRRALLASLVLFEKTASRIASLTDLVDFNHREVQSEIHRILANA